ncbi:MAG: hypothetical protein HY423_07995, partial [Candidatus Lambdaproteobacteria bacterium]|nr:hypothetical protein [Candidatus Lambdaproteobacteria bacterium]
GPQTSALLRKLNLLRARDEVRLCQGFDQQTSPCPVTPFEPVSPIIFGGTESFVNVSFAEANTYVTADLPSNVATASTLLGSLGSGFTTKLLDRRAGRTLTFDDTEVKAMQAITAAMRGVISLPTIWTTTDADAFITGNSTRDPVTGQVTNEITNAETVAYFDNDTTTPATGTTGVRPLQAVSTAITAVQTAFMDAFGSLRDTITSLLAESATVEAQGVIRLSDPNPRYDKQPDVQKLNLALVKSMANDLSDSFDPATGAPTVSIYQAVGTITDFGVCDPLAAATTDLSRNLNPGFSSTTPTSSINQTYVRTIDLNSATGAAIPPAVQSDGASYYKLVLSALPSPGISIFSRDRTGNCCPNAMIGWDDGTNIHWVDSDNNSGQDGAFGMSYPTAYFDNASFPSTPPTLYIKVYVNANDFQVFAWTATQDSNPLPIFLKGGGGRNFAVKVNRTPFPAKGAALIQLMGSVWDDSTRSTLVLDDPATPLVDEMSLQIPTATLVSRLGAVLTDYPALGDYTITDETGAVPTDLTNFDLFKWNIEPTAEPATTDVTSGIGTTYVPGAVVPTGVCAYPFDFGRVEDVEGGYSL